MVGRGTRVQEDIGSVVQSREGRKLVEGEDEAVNKDDGPIHQEAMAHVDRHQHRRFRERDLRFAPGTVLPAGGE